MRAIQRKFRKATSTPKGRIIAAAILFTLLLAVAGGILYWQTHKKKIIRDKLESAIHKKSDGLYTLKYDSLELDEITGYLSVTNLTLHYDSLKYQALRQQDKAPPILLNIRIPQITVTGVKTPQALIDKEIIGKKLEIRNPSIEIVYTMEGKDSARNVPSRETYEQILGDLNLISIDTIAITDGQITTRNLKTKKRSIELAGVQVQLLGVQVDSAANADTSRLFFSKEVSLACKDLSWWSANKLYKYGVSDLVLYSTNHTASVKRFVIQPALGEDAFVRALPTQDDRFDFTLQDIAINDLDFQQLIQEEVEANTISIGSATFKIYRDLNIPRDTKNRVGTYPHQAISKIPIPVLIKKILVNNAFIEYKERNQITKEAGKVQFYNAQATITNLTNNKAAIAQNNTMTADINCRFLNKTPFHVVWLFYLQNPNGRFDVKGTLGGMDATALNPLTEPMGPARIEKGTIQGVDFNFEGSDHAMTGSLRLLYDNLKIALLEKEEGEKKLDKKNLTSFIANLLIKNSNPARKDEDPRTVNVTNTRDTNRSIFYLAWKTLFKGCQETLGIKSKAPKN